MKQNYLHKLHSWLILGCIVLFSHASYGQCGDSIDLGTWVQEGAANNGTWTVTGGGNAVNQTINGEPTFYVSPDSFINVIITGDIRVATTADDDWVGFVFGYNDPDTSTPNNFDFYLFDWKQNNQNFGGFLGNEGFALSRVQGPVVNLPEAFSGKAGPFVNPLATQYGNNEGWNDLQTYSFALTYTNTRTVISIDGDTIFDIFGCFPPGRFGFYNYSQSDVEYSNFSYKVAAAFEVLTPDVCLGDTARFIALSDSCENAAGIPVNNTLVSWFWNFGDGFTSNDTNANHYYQNPGTYNVSLVVTDYLGCKDTAYSTVEVFDVSTNLGSDTALCIGDTAILDAGPGFIDYAWNTGAITQTIQVNNPGNYVVTVTGGGGCSDTDTVVITNIALPVVNIGPDTSICNSDTLVLEAGNPGASFLWNDGSTFDSLIVNDSGTFFVEVTYPSGCSNTDTAIISNYAQPVVSPPNPELCFGDTVSISAAGAQSYTWFPSFGLSATTGTVVETFTTVDTTYAVVGIDSNGCTDTSIFNVDVFELPTVSISGGDSICFGDSTMLYLSFTGVGPWDLSYTINGDTIQRNGITTNLDSFYVSDSGMYTPIFVSDSRCSNTGMDSAYVYLRPLPTITFSSTDDSLCIGDTMAISAQGAQSYTWSPSTGLNDSTLITVLANPTNSIVYQVLGTDQFGCSDTSSFGLDVLALPVLSTTATPNPICKEDTVTLEASGADSYFWVEMLNNDTILGDSIIDTPMVSTTYTLHGTDIYGCSNSTTQNVQVDTLPVVSIAPADTSICIFETTPLTASGANTYVWQPAASLNMSTGTTVMASPNDTTIYYVEGTDLNGCRGRDSVNVTVWDLPNITVTAGSTEICIGDSLTLYADGAESYAWEDNYAILNQTGDSTIVFPQTDTTYTAIGTDTNGCVSTDDYDVIVNPLPIITLETPNDSICRFDNTMLTAGGANSYSWTNTPGLSAYNQATVIASPNTTATFEVFGTDVNGCVNSNDTLVHVIPLPNIVATPAVGAMCFGQTKQINLPSQYSYDWSPLASLQLSGANNETALANPTDTTVYQITATNGFGCESDTTYELAVTPLPAIVTSVDDSIVCPGITTTLHVSGNYNFHWEPGIYVTGSSSANPTVSPQTTRTYYVTATGPGNCKSNDSVKVEVYPTGPFTAGDDTVMCRRDTIQLQASGGISYQWEPSIGLNQTNVDNPLCFTLANRFYYVTITDANNCVEESAVFVKVNQLPTVRAGLNDTMCIGDSVFIGGQPTGPTGSTYKWTPDYALSNSIAPNPQAKPDTSTTYSVRVTDTNGCSDTKSTNVVVKQLAPLEVISKPHYLCEGDTASIRVTPGIHKYIWSPADLVSDSSKSNPLVFPGDSTEFTVEAYTKAGCKSVLTFNLPVPHKPFVNIRGNFEMCFGDTVRVDATADEGVDFAWMPEDVFIKRDTLAPQVFAENITDITLKVIDSLNCRNSDKAIVFVHQLPLADAGADMDNCDMDDIYIGGAVTTTEENTWEWSPAGKLNNPKSLNPKVLSISNDTFVLKVVSPEGCTNNDTVIANSDCYRHLYVPNTFTPDGDGINDVFLAVGRNIYETEMLIYDRLGHLIFRSQDIERGWDGTYMDSGKPAPIGTYFWQLTFRTKTGRGLSDEGLVNIVR